MKRTIIFFFFAVTFNIEFAQQMRIDPSPACGWDSLKSYIVYPEGARRAGVEGYAEATVEVDSSGNIINTRIFSMQFIFEKSIKDAILKTKWIPAKNGDKNVEGEVRFPILFVLKDSWNKRCMIIESEKIRPKWTTNN